MVKSRLFIAVSNNTLVSELQIVLGSLVMLYALLAQPRMVVLWPLFAIRNRFYHACHMVFWIFLQSHSPEKCFLNES